MTRRPRIVAVIQARMNSSRLPGKILMSFAGAPMLQRLVERVSGAKTLDGLVIATSDTQADDPVEALCNQIGVSCHRGSEIDVLGRMLGAAQSHRADVLVRLTADNPFVDASLVDFVVGCFLGADEQVDYVQNVDDCGFPFGLYVEVCTMDALREANAQASAEEREHVTLYVRQRPDAFAHIRVEAPGAFQETHLSVDTPEDHARLKPLFERLHAENPAFGMAELVSAREMGPC